MRVSKLFLIVLAFLVAAAECNAAEPILEPHAMLYFEIPLGSRHEDRIKPAFGFRMDTAMVEPHKSIDYPKLFSRPAMLDLRFGQAGIKELKISGVDFLKQVRTLHANGDDTGSTADKADTPPANAGASEASTATEQQSKEGSAEKKGGLLSKLPDYSNAIRKSQYVGLAIGAVIGFVFLANSF